MSEQRIDGTACAEGLSRLAVDVRAAMTLAMRAAIQAAEDNAKATALYATHSAEGLRKGTVGSFDPSAMTGQVVADTPYARFVENGRPAIEAGAGKMLRFVINGQVIFRKRVKAAAPRPFMHAARGVGEQTLDYGAEVYLNAAIERT